MENLKNKICKSLPYFCCAGMQAPEMVIQPELKEEEEYSSNSIKSSSKQKPWSVFGDLYWL
jgi:hypothetical protein